MSTTLLAEVPTVDTESTTDALPERVLRRSLRVRAAALLACVGFIAVIALQMTSAHNMLTSRSDAGARVSSFGFTWQPVGWRVAYSDGTQRTRLLWT